MSAPVVIGSNVKIPVSATDKVIYLFSSTMAAGSTIILNESSSNTAYTVPVGRKLLIVQYQITVGHISTPTNWAKFWTSGGILINHFDLFHTNADAYVIIVDGYTEVAAGNTVNYEDSWAGSTAQVLGVETDV